MTPVNVLSRASLLKLRLVSVCLNILFSLPSRFMEAGGWAILNLWLAEAKKNQNLPLIVEILQVRTLFMM